MKTDQCTKNKEEFRLKAKIREFYTEQGKINDHQKSMYYLGSPFSLWLQGKRNFYIKKMIDLVKNRSFLDVGCAEGLHVIYNADRWNSYSVGVDISAPKLDRAKLHTGSNSPLTDFVLADAEHLPLRTNTFELTLCNDVIRYLPNPQKAVEELVRVSKDSCILSSGTHYLTYSIKRTIKNIAQRFSRRLIAKDTNEIISSFEKVTFGGGELWFITPSWMINKVNEIGQLRLAIGHYQELIAIISYLLRPLRDSKFYLRCADTLDKMLAPIFPFNHLGWFTTLLFSIRKKE